MSSNSEDRAARDRRMAKLREKYITGRATPEEVHEFWVEAMGDPKQLELLKIEINLRLLHKKND